MRSGEGHGHEDRRAYVEDVDVFKVVGVLTGQQDQ
jgi:hypothetical protein